MFVLKSKYNALYEAYARLLLQNAELITENSALFKLFNELKFPIEPVAALCHEQWSGWMRYLFDNGYTSDGGVFVINAGSAARWWRQMNTPYEELSEAEKESDRKEARKFVELFGQTRTICSECAQGITTQQAQSITDRAVANLIKV